MTPPAPVAPTPASSWSKSCHLLNSPASSLEWFSNSQFYRPCLRSIIRRASIQRILRQSTPRSQNGASPETSEGNDVVDRLAASREAAAAPVINGLEDGASRKNPHPESVLCPPGQWTGLRGLAFEPQNTGLTPYSSKLNLARVANQAHGSDLAQVQVPERAAGPARRWGILAALRLRRACVPNAGFRGTLAKTEGLFSNRATYRRGGHFDHLRHGRSQLSSFPPPCQ